MKEPTADVLRVDNLGIRRGKTRILEKISWQIRPREHWVILGANGSGKTSLLSALTGYLTPTEGQMVLLQEQYGRSDWRQLRSKVGLVSSSIRQMMPNHEPALISVASGRYGIIDYWGDPKPADVKAAMKFLREVECAELADRPWLYLSQGERQRVLIGRALIAQPKILILDEPCAGLDPAARENFLEFLNRFGRRDNAPTLVLVTHHVEEITPVFSHGLVLKNGRVLAAGRKNTVVNSQILSEALNVKVYVTSIRGRYRLRVASRTRHIL